MTCSQSQRFFSILIMNACILACLAIVDAGLSAGVGGGVGEEGVGGGVGKGTIREAEEFFLNDPLTASVYHLSFGNRDTHASSASAANFASSANFADYANAFNFASSASSGFSDLQRRYRNRVLGQANAQSDNGNGPRRRNNEFGEGFNNRGFNGEIPRRINGETGREVNEELNGSSDRTLSEESNGTFNQGINARLNGGSVEYNGESNDQSLRFNGEFSSELVRRFDKGFNPDFDSSKASDGVGHGDQLALMALETPHQGQSHYQDLVRRVGTWDEGQGHGQGPVRRVGTWDEGQGHYQGHGQGPVRSVGTWDGVDDKDKRNPWEFDVGYSDGGTTSLGTNVYGILSVFLFTAFLAYIIYVYMSLGASERSYGSSQVDAVAAVLDEVTNAFERWATFEYLPQEGLKEDMEDLEEEEEAGNEE